MATVRVTPTVTSTTPSSPASTVAETFAAVPTIRRLRACTLPRRTVSCCTSVAGKARRGFVAIKHPPDPPLIPRWLLAPSDGTRRPRWLRRSAFRKLPETSSTPRFPPGTKARRMRLWRFALVANCDYHVCDLWRYYRRGMPKNTITHSLSDRRSQTTDH